MPFQCLSSVEASPDETLELKAGAVYHIGGGILVDPNPSSS